MTSPLCLKIIANIMQLFHARLSRFVLLMCKAQLSKSRSNCQKSEFIYLSRCFAAGVKCHEGTRLRVRTSIACTICVSSSLYRARGACRGGRGRGRGLPTAPRSAVRSEPARRGEGRADVVMIVVVIIIVIIVAVIVVVIIVAVIVVVIMVIVMIVVMIIIARSERGFESAR